MNLLNDKKTNEEYRQKIYIYNQVICRYPNLTLSGLRVADFGYFGEKAWNRELQFFDLNLKFHSRK